MQLYCPEHLSASSAIWPCYATTLHRGVQIMHPQCNQNLALPFGHATIKLGVQIMHPQCKPKLGTTILPCYYQKRCPNYASPVQTEDRLLTQQHLIESSCTNFHNRQAKFNVWKSIHKMKISMNYWQLTTLYAVSYIFT